MDEPFVGEGNHLGQQRGHPESLGENTQLPNVVELNDRNATFLGAGAEKPGLDRDSEPLTMSGRNQVGAYVVDACDLKSLANEGVRNKTFAEVADPLCSPRIRFDGLPPSPVLSTGLDWPILIITDTSLEKPAICGLSPTVDYALAPVALARSVPRTRQLKGPHVFEIERRGISLVNRRGEIVFKRGMGGDAAECWDAWGRAEFSRL